MVTMTAVGLPRVWAMRHERTRVPTPGARTAGVTTATPPARGHEKWFEGFEGGRRPEGVGRPTKRPPGSARAAYVEALRKARAKAEAEVPPVPMPEVFPLPGPDRYRALARAAFRRFKPTEVLDRGVYPMRDPRLVWPGLRPGRPGGVSWRTRAKAEAKAQAVALVARDRAWARARAQAAKEASAGMRREAAEARRKTAEAAAAYRVARAERTQTVARALVPFHLARLKEGKALARDSPAVSGPALPRWTKATAHRRARAKEEAEEDAALAKKIKAGEMLTRAEAYKPWRRVVRARFDPTPRLKRDAWGVQRRTPPIPKRRPTTRAERDTDPAVALTLRRRQLARRGVVPLRGVPLDPLGAFHVPGGSKGSK